MSSFLLYMEIAVIYITLAMVVKYVFLENTLPGIKQVIFHAVSLAISLLVGWLFGTGVAELIIIVLAATNIMLANMDSKIKELLMIIPMIGIVDGLTLPLLILPTKILSFSPKAENTYTTIVYVIMVLALIAFYYFGRDWRREFNSELHDRKLQQWEKTLLTIIGLIQIIFSIMLNRSIENIGGVSNRDLRVILILLGFSSFVMTITVISVVMVGNKRAFYQDKISDMQRSIIVTMAEIVENRDANTGGHIRRTAKYVEIIANELKKEGLYSDILTDEYIRDIRIAAPLHDIGKIHVPDLILNKPGRLNADEFDKMKMHAPAGRDLLVQAKDNLGDFSYLDMAIDMAGYHHEWWDGSMRGYPDHKSGDEIPLCARIMAVADVFDALVSRRIYKPAMPIEKALGIIREETGTHFDPAIATAFFRAKDQILEAVDTFYEEEDQVDQWENAQTRIY